MSCERVEDSSNRAERVGAEQGKCLAIVTRAISALVAVSSTAVAVLISASQGVASPLVAAQGQTSGSRLPAPNGTVQGVVRLGGSSTVPRPTLVRNTTDPVVCGRAHTLEDWLVSGTNRGVQNVILTVEGVPPEKIRSLVPGRLVLENKRCGFVPHASVLTVGSTIETVNRDPVLHTVHFYGPMDVNIALPVQGMRVARRVDTAGMVVVKCDVHGWMQAFVGVDIHPFHGVSDVSGVFRISDIPPGDYVLHAWHEKLGDHRETVHVRAGEITTLVVTYSGGQK